MFYVLKKKQLMRIIGDGKPFAKYIPPCMSKMLCDLRDGMA